MYMRVCDVCARLCVKLLFHGSLYRLTDFINFHETASNKYEHHDAVHGVHRHAGRHAEF